MIFAKFILSMAFFVGKYQQITAQASVTRLPPLQSAVTTANSSISQRNLFLTLPDSDPAEVLRKLMEYLNSSHNLQINITEPITSTNTMSNFSSISITNATSASTSVNESLETLQFDPKESCGVFPACSIEAIQFSNILAKNITSETEIGLVAECSKPLASFITAITILLSIVIVLSNLLIITITLRTRSLQRPHSCFKISLAIADLIAGAVVLPSVIYNIFTEIYYNQPKVFQQSLAEVRYTATAGVCGIAGILATVVAVYSLLLLSIDGFLSMRWPLQYRIGDIMTRKKALFAVIVIWLFAIAVSALPLLSTEFIVYGLNYITMQYIPILKPSEEENIFRYWHAILYAVFVWGIPFIATWILTIISTVDSNRMLKGLRNARDHSYQSANALDKVERNFRRTVSVVLIMFTITILPVFIVLLYIALRSQASCLSESAALAFFVCTYILICGRFINVIIYNVFNKEFREGCRKFFHEIFISLRCAEGKLHLHLKLMQSNKSNRKEKKSGNKSIALLRLPSKTTSSLGAETGSTVMHSTRDNRSTSLSVDAPKDSSRHEAKEI